MPPHIDEIMQHIDDLLDPSSFVDYCPVGLQVAGRSRHVTTIATAVSSTLSTFEQAAKLKAELILVHHGLFWKGSSQIIDPVMRERLFVLFENEITLAGYHLCLDAHPVIGNNALIADALELTRIDTRFATHGGSAIGMIGHLAGDGLPLSHLVERLQDILNGRTPLILGNMPSDQIVRRIAICSGGAAADIDEAAKLGCDVFITGEPREDTNARAQELNIAFLAAGHHATETFGIRALGDHLAQTFEITHHFIDAANPV